MDLDSGAANSGYAKILLKNSPIRLGKVSTHNGNATTSHFRVRQRETAVWVQCTGSRISRLSDSHRRLWARWVTNLWQREFNFVVFWAFSWAML